jgi:hypothetical protein
LARAPRRLCSEAELAAAWAERRYPPGWLTDSLGRQLKVIFPGRRWGGPGPDFRGALLVLQDGTLVRGDVEIHRRARDWIAHGHTHDPSYADVVLHVVQRMDAATPDAHGAPIPTLELAPWPAWPSGPPWHSQGTLTIGAPCVRDAPSILAVVEAAGRERFRAKAARFESDLASGMASPDQVLWRAIAAACGYTRNVGSFGLLATAVPWLEAAAVVRERGPVGLAGLLLGAAGLRAAATLPEAHAWVALQRHRGWRPALNANAWDHRAARAANAPVERCRGLAELAARWAAWPSDGSAARRWRTSTLAGPALEVVEQAARARRPRLWPFAWAGPWIGRGRAQVIAINVLLPFAAAAGLAEAEALFERMPGEPSNRVVRYMAAQLGAPALRFRGACQQQGLLHLFKLTCAARICERCPARRIGDWPEVEFET